MTKAIRVENLSKRYYIGQGKTAAYETLSERITDMLTGPLRSIRSVLQGQSSAVASDSIWALKDVSFEVEHGEVVGIIGRNGAGKSTLLKILSQITEPTEGHIDLYGRVGALLEVGTGFHPELTGRENVFLNGAILGMTRNDIQRKFDEIVDFSGVEKFIDTPVKHYSSGMQVRLAFAVAAHLEPEILVVDEVLAVGDAEFQKKCLGKMGDVTKEGRTVLFVSHNMGAIRQLCERAILLDVGNIYCDGDSISVIGDYLKKNSKKISDIIEDTADLVNRSGTGEGKIIKIELEDSKGVKINTFSIGEPILIKMHVHLFKELSSLVLGTEIESSTGVPLLNLRSDSQGVSFGPYGSDKTIILSFKIPGLPFYPGVYQCYPWFAQRRGKRVDHLHEGIEIIIESGGYYKSEKMFQQGKGIVVMDCEWFEETNPAQNVSLDYSCGI